MVDAISSTVRFWKVSTRRMGVNEVRVGWTRAMGNFIE